MRSLQICYLFTVFSLCSFVSFAQPTAFKYQGSMNDGANPANGTFQMQFRLCKNLSCSATSGQTIFIPSVIVTNGVFAVDLDFTSAAVIWENDRYLEVSVRRTDQESFTVLLPRQQVLSAPFSIKAKNADIAANATNANNAANATNLAGLPADRYVQTDMNGNVAIGTTPNGSKLTVAGVIESTTGGIKFPNGSVQTTAGLTAVSANSPLTGNGTPASPLGVQVPLSIRDVNPASRQPFYSSGGIIIVPAGKLLVIEQISGLIELQPSAPLPWILIVIDGVSKGFVMPTTWSDQSPISRYWLFNSQVKYYVPAGQSFSLTHLNPLSSVKHVQGYYVDVP